ncbi:MAG: glycerol-3-phosphate acyltransferase, partial [Lactococcus sp.]|nr:glycerol-3-phosphate acyltransferase [Lactococcus sp.]
LGVIFIIAFYLTSMVSFASVLGAACAGILVLILPSLHLILTSYDWIFTAIMFFLACFIIFRHRENIARIRNKSENVFNFGLNLTHQKHNI